MIMHPVVGVPVTLSEALPYAVVAAGIVACYHILASLARELMPAPGSGRIRTGGTTKAGVEIRKALMELHQALSDLPDEQPANPLPVTQALEALRESRQREAYRLNKQGVAGNEIAARLKLSRGEVALIRAVEHMRNGSARELCTAEK